MLLDARSGVRQWGRIDAPRNGNEMIVHAGLSTCGDPDVVKSNCKAANALEAIVNGKSNSDLHTADFINPLTLKFPGYEEIWYTKEKSRTRADKDEMFMQVMEQ